MKNIYYIINCGSKVPYFFVSGMIEKFLKVFGDECMAFVGLKYFVCDVFPGFYFQDKDVRDKEMIKFCELAKVLRPKVLKTLMLKKSGKGESDLTAFEITLGNLSSDFFSSFFNYFSETETLRILDYLLIHGFDFLHKLLIALLSSKEKQIISNIQKLNKSIKDGPNRDLLIFISNYSLDPVISAQKTTKIEILLRKSTKKQKYSKIDLSTLPTLVLNSQDKLLTRLKNAKEDFKGQTLADWSDLITKAKNLSINGQIPCLEFQKLLSVSSMPKPLQFTFLSLLCQKPCAMFAISAIISLVPIVSSLSMTEKLNFLFGSFSSTLTITSTQGNELIKSLLSYCQEFQYKNEYFVTNANIEEFLKIVENDSDLIKILKVLEIEPRQKSFQGSYIEDSSNNSVEDSEDSQEFVRDFNGSQVEINLFPALVKTNENKIDRGKCARLCGPTCVII